MIKSKTYLKQKILHDMVLQGKIEKAPASDLLRTNSHHGWKVIPHKAFRNVDPVILA